MGVYKRGPVYWISYSYNNKQYRESAGTSDRAQAQALLKKRKDEIFAKRLEKPSPIAKEESGDLFA